MPVNRTNIINRACANLLSEENIHYVINMADIFSRSKYQLKQINTEVRSLRADRKQLLILFTKKVNDVFDSPAFSAVETYFKF